MKSFMSSRPASSGGSANFPEASVASAGQSSLFLKVLLAALLSAGLLIATASLGAESVVPVKPQPRSDAVGSVQSQVDKQAADVASDKRKKLIAEAATAIAQTQQALKALDEKRTDDALRALADATGRLELIIAREPGLKLAPVSTSVVTYDLLATPDTVRVALAEARRALGDGAIAHARLLVETLASETQVRTTNIPLATYPAAIKAATPLIDAGRTDEARAQLQTALSTLIITTEVIALPKIRAENMLKEAQVLTEQKDRSKEDEDKLRADLRGAREQLQMAELLGYGKKQDYQPMYTQLDAIERASAGGKSGTGWFDKIRKQVADIL